MVRIRSFRGGMALALAISALLAVQGVALADTSLTETGITGPHHLGETSAVGSGAHCEYGTAAGRLDQVKAARPFVKAHDDHPGNGNDPQKVGWRAIFQAQTTTGWDTVFVGHKQWAVANDNAFAVFPSTYQTWTADGPGFVIRVLIEMSWYSRTVPSTVVGTSRHRVDFYQVHLEGSATFTRESTDCRSNFGP